MLVHIFASIVILSASGALCAGDNPLSGRNLRVVAMEVSTLFFYYCLSITLTIPDALLVPTLGFISIVLSVLVNYTVSFVNYNGKKRYRTYRSCRSRSDTYDRAIKSDAQL